MDAHTPEQTGQAPHRDLRKYSRANETASRGEFVNSLLVEYRDNAQGVALGNE